jgi:hypothetical protein
VESVDDGYLEVNVENEGTQMVFDEDVRAVEGADEEIEEPAVCEPSDPFDAALHKIVTAQVTGGDATANRALCGAIKVSLCDSSPL